MTATTTAEAIIASAPAAGGITAQPGERAGGTPPVSRGDPQAVGSPNSRVVWNDLRPAGRLVLVGLPADNVFPLPIFETVLRGIQVVGSIVGTREDLAEVFQLHAGGRTRVVLERRELDQVNECFADVLAGVVPARLVFDLR